jgi:hypothetical protein
VEPPGPVPNPEVKHFSADGSWAIGPVRVGRRQVICPLLANAGSGLFCAQMPESASGAEGKRGVWSVECGVWSVECGGGFQPPSLSTTD